MIDSPALPVSQPATACDGQPSPTVAPTVAQPLLFAEADMPAVPTTPSPPAPATTTQAGTRINRPERFQGEFRAESLDERLDADHLARLVWTFVETIDLAELFQAVKAVEGHVGRNASDFRVLFALLLWAAIDGVASAREIERLVSATAPTSGCAAACPSITTCSRISAPSMPTCSIACCPNRWPAS